MARLTGASGPHRFASRLGRATLSHVEPEIHYARSGDVNIAYQVVGDGPLDLVYAGGFASHIGLLWEEPLAARFFSRLARFSRVILFDRRGTGLSDPVPVNDLPDLEQRMDDLRAVMGAAGSQRAVQFGLSEGGPMCLLFAATYPERTTALVLWSTYPRAIKDDEFPEGWLPPEEVEPLADELEYQWRLGDLALVREWGMTEGLSPAEHERVNHWAATYLRQAVTPGAVRALTLMSADMDVRAVLPAISAPTLLLVRAEDENAPATRFIADRIAGARYVELPGQAHFPFLSSDQDVILAEIEEFLTGIRPQPDPDRVLATVLFTDIVDSTAIAAQLGDRSWRDVVERHHGLVRKQLSRFGGVEIDTAGDGFFASFDGPARAIRCAGAIIDSVRALGLDVRAGLHTGECERLDGKVGGMAVHVGARVAAEANAGEVLVSQTVKDIVVGSGIQFSERGPSSLKGVPGEWRLFAVDHDPSGEVFRPPGRG